MSCALLVGATMAGGFGPDVACSPSAARANVAAREAAPAAELAVAPPADAPAVVLVVIDGARWQEIFRGVDPTLGDGDIPAAELLPNLYALVRDRGLFVGAPGDKAIRASGPNFVSLPGYEEIFSGRRDSGCASNDCAATMNRTLADDVQDASGSPGDAAVFSSWEVVERAASAEPSRIVMSTGRHHARRLDVLTRDPATESLLRHGDAAAPFPGEADYRPDANTAALALRYLETKRPRFLFLALGETDEYAHRGDYAGYVAALREADRVLGELAATLERIGRSATTTVFVTADHGRSLDFRSHGDEESARVWLAVFGSRIALRPNGAPRPHRLADIAPAIRALLCLRDKEAEGAGLALEEIFAEPARGGCVARQLREAGVPRTSSIPSSGTSS